MLGNLWSPRYAREAHPSIQSVNNQRSLGYSGRRTDRMRGSHFHAVSGVSSVANARGAEFSRLLRCHRGSPARSQDDSTELDRAA